LALICLESDLSTQKHSEHHIQQLDDAVIVENPEWNATLVDVSMSRPFGVESDISNEHTWTNSLGIQPLLHLFILTLLPLLDNNFLLFVY